MSQNQYSAMVRSLTPGVTWERRFLFLIVDVPASYHAIFFAIVI